jgi:uncharacterized protein (TIGR02145 family)
MKKISFMLLCLLLVSCQHETKVIENAVTDVEGNSYPAAKIGKHIWMLQDLKTTRFAEYTLMWHSAYYNQEFDWKMIAAIKHPQYPVYNKGAIRYMRNTKTPDLGPCPQGWHVPSVAEWEDLIQTVGKRSDWVERSGSVNGAMVADPESSSRCEFLNASGFNAVLDRSGFMFNINFKDITPGSHYDKYKCYWALDEGDLSADGRDNCTYVQLSHPSLDNPNGESEPEIKRMTATEEDGQPLFFVRCVKDKKKREVSWHVYD